MTRQKVLVTFLCTPFLCYAQTDTSEDDLLQREVRITLIPGLSTNGIDAPRYNTKYSLNLLAGYNGGLDSYELGLVNINRYFSRGLQLGLLNVSRGEMRGTQLSAFGNLSTDDLQGMQFSGIFNISSDSSQGILMSGVTNIVDQGEGVQIGLVNYARQFEGVPVGFISYYGNGKKHGSLSSQMVDSLTQVLHSLLGMSTINSRSVLIPSFP